MKSEKSRLLFQIVLFVFCLAVVLLLFFHVFLVERNGKKHVHPVSSSPARTVSPVRRTPVVQAIEKTLPSVVNLSTGRIVERENSMSSNHYPEGDVLPLRNGYSIGSGIIVDRSGLILTSAHVVRRSSDIEITLNNGVTLKAKSFAESTENDIALLRITDPVGELKPIRMINPSDMILGETIIAVGNPFGLDGTVTVGVLSGIDRMLVRNGGVLFRDLLQTDVAVYPGSSGGPLINLDGKMLGMNMAVRRDSPGIGFAIPVLRIANVLAKWMLPERLRSLYLGIVPGMDRSGTVFVESVLPESPAERAGIQPGAVIDSFNGWNPDGDLLGLCSRLLRVRAEEELEFHFKTSPRRVRLRAEPIREGDGILLAKLKLGIGLQQLTPILANSLKYPFRTGIVLNDIPAQLIPLGVQRGDMLVRMGDRAIHSPNDVAKALRDPLYFKRIPLSFIAVRSADGRYVFREYRIVMDVH